MTRGDMAGGPAHATIEPQTARAQASPAAGWNALLLAAFVVGIALRVWQIDIQILIDDEWHAIHKLLRSAPTDILTHLGYADYMTSEVGV
jgi:hypothetical protein